MDILYQDNSILVCIKPAGVLSTDEPGGVPELVRQALGDPNACVRTVHRLDRVVSGLMVLAVRNSVDRGKCRVQHDCCLPDTARYGDRKCSADRKRTVRGSGRL